jgi:hypothetical protein
MSEWLPGDPWPAGPVPPEPPGTFRQDMHDQSPDGPRYYRDFETGAFVTPWYPIKPGQCPVCGQM